MDKPTIIIADDLTGACDTALQYFKIGRKVRIVVDISKNFFSTDNIDVLAISTESRNISKEDALELVCKVASGFAENVNSIRVFKKIDSTLRGNVGVEIVSMLETLHKDAAIIAPAYIEEERTTIGGYQLLKGIPIERTQCALDPKSPIFDSYIPNIIVKDLNESFVELVDVIDFKTITKGAGPINLKINELIQKGKKIIVADAVSNTDLEQIALAIKRCGYNILPCASAGLAQAFNNYYKKDVLIEENKIHIPNIPRFIVSGSATQLNAVQIQKLKEASKNVYILELQIQDILNNEIENIVNDISEKLSAGYDVLVSTTAIHTEITKEVNENLLIDAGVAKDELPEKITDYISELVLEINYKNNFILVIVGGETCYKCSKKIKSKYLDIIDAILPAIPLCIDAEGKIIVTKSGNFGTSSTLVDIINYFDKLK